MYFKQKMPNFIPALRYRSILACIHVCMNKATLQFTAHTAEAPRHLHVPTRSTPLQDHGCWKGTKPQCRWLPAPVDITVLLVGAGRLFALFLNTSSSKNCAKEAKDLYWRFHSSLHMIELVHLCISTQLKHHRLFYFKFCFGVQTSGVQRARYIQDRKSFPHYTARGRCSQSSNNAGDKDSFSSLQ